MHLHIQRSVTRALAAALALTAPTAMGGERELDFHDLQAVDTGHHDYYELRKDDRGTYLHADYRPGDDAVKQALVIRDAERPGRHRLSWRWRALVLPTGGNECDPNKTDSAASVYIAWRRGLRWYGLKYAWSSVGPLGAVCDRRDNAVMRGETIIQRTGGPLGTWVDESVDLEAEFRKHFVGGDPNGDVPNFIGVAVLTDGDATRSAASADFGSFVLHQDP
jgi:hypothetical protein